MFLKLIERAAEQLNKKLPFVVYRKPNENEVYAIFQNHAQLHYVKDFTEIGFIFAPFNTDKPIPLLQVDEKISATFHSSVSRSKGDSKEIYSEIDNLKKEFHINLVKKGIRQIQHKKFKKVVLSRSIEVACSGDPITLFQQLLTIYNTAFCYLWFHPKIGMWLGATPEILVKTENQKLTTMSLAGTQQYTNNESPNWGAKELQEQSLVTQYIYDAINGAVSNLAIEDTTSFRAGNLWHLRTKLGATFSKEKLASIVNSLHPTPAVCGMPMPATKAFIIKHENYDREYYTGYLGELNFKIQKDRVTRRNNLENKAYKSIKTNTTLYVNLRCMQLKDNVAKLYVGGGVTIDSDPEKEWQETVAKSDTMLKVLFPDLEI